MEENFPQHSRSDTGASPNVECFQNYNASEVFVQGLAGMVNQQDTETIIRSQKYMLQRFEKTNEMLINCNQLSAARFQNAARDFKKHTGMLQEMKKDIDNIFRRIRNIKAKIAQQYPQAYDVAATAQRREKSQQDDEDDEEVEQEANINYNIPPSSSKSSSISSSIMAAVGAAISSPSSSTTISQSHTSMDRSASIDIPKTNKSSDV